jgi:hypothetical protein
MLLKAIKPPAPQHTQRFDSEREGHKHTYISAAQRRDNISRGCKTHTDKREHQKCLWVANKHGSIFPTLNKNMLNLSQENKFA